MNKVYVRWYGNVLEGEVAENRRTDQLADMVAVRIPIQGVHATAMFAPGHVYASEDDASRQAALPARQRQVVSEKGRVIEQERQVITAKAPSEAWMSMLQWKQEHWDHERNHLRIDALDEFYELCKIEYTPFGFVEAVPQNRTPLKPAKHVSKQCLNCKYWKFTRTLGSPDEPEWHCRDGFSPSKDCQDEAAYNDRCMENDPKQRPADWNPEKPIVYNKPAKPVTATQLSLFD